MDTEEKYQHIFFYFIKALRVLAMDPQSQCEAEGNFNVAQEIQYEIRSGRYVLGKGKLNLSEEAAIASLASAVAPVPDSALTRPQCHLPNVNNISDPASQQI